MTLTLNIAIQYFPWTLFWLLVIYHQNEFGCKRLISLELIKDIVETIVFMIIEALAVTLTLTLKTETHFFRMTFPFMMVHHTTKFG